MKNYSDLLKDPRWQKKRLEIFNRDKFTCKLCGDTETTLQIHHKEYISGNDPWDYPNSILVTLCKHCHEEIENLKKDEEFNYEFKDVKIYKSDGWTDDNRIMFVSYPGICGMSIYNEKDEFVIGFNISFDIAKDIIKILKKCLP